MSRYGYTLEKFREQAISLSRRSNRNAIAFGALAGIALVSFATSTNIRHTGAVLVMGSMVFGFASQLTNASINALNLSVDRETDARVKTMATKAHNFLLAGGVMAGITAYLGVKSLDLSAVQASWDLAAIVKSAASASWNTAALFVVSVLSNEVAGRSAAREYNAVAPRASVGD